MSTQTVLKERGDDVLAAGSHQELLLAAGDPQEPFVVELSNVAGVEPSVYQGPAGGCLVVAVGREDVVALDLRISPSSAIWIATPGSGLPTVPILIRSGVFM